MKPVFLENFEREEDVWEAFEMPAPRGLRILFAWYGYGSYCGDCFVLCEQDDQLFTVEASHCSCHGIEGQWTQDKASLEELRYRMKEGRLGEDDSECKGSNFAPILTKVLDEYEAEKKGGVMEEKYDSAELNIPPVTGRALHDALLVIKQKKMIAKLKRDARVMFWAANIGWALVGVFATLYFTK